MSDEHHTVDKKRFMQRFLRELYLIWGISVRAEDKIKFLEEHFGVSLTEDAERLTLTDDDSKLSIYERDLFGGLPYFPEYWEILADRICWENGVDFKDRVAVARWLEQNPLGKLLLDKYTTVIDVFQALASPAK